jgi:integrase
MMARLKLTARAIAGLSAPDPSGRQTLHWDSELKGFGVLCSGTTASKTFIVQRDLPGGRTRRVTIAPVNVIDLDKARLAAQGVLADFYKGVDPKAGRRGEATLRTALEDYLRARESGEQALRPGSMRAYRDSVEKQLTPWLDTPLRNITREMVERRLGDVARKVSERTNRANGHGRAAANSAMRALRVLYNFAADRAPPSNPMPSNPVKLKKQWLPVERRTRMVAEDDLPIFYKAVCALPSPVARDYLLLVLFTGFRRNEAAALRWDEIDFKERVIRLPAARAKAGKKLDLPMSDFVHDLLVARRSIGDAKWVFPANSKSGHLEEPKFPLKMVAEACGITVSVHDLRRTFITVAESTDMSVNALKALVNHSLGKDVTEGYVQMSAERLREPAQRVTDRLKSLIGLAPIEAENVKKIR